MTGAVCYRGVHPGLEPGVDIPAAQARNRLRSSSRVLSSRERGNAGGVQRRRRSLAGRGRGHRVLSVHRADGGTARRGAAA